VRLENNAGQEPVRHLNVVARIAQLPLWRKNLAMALIQHLAQLLGVGEIGAPGHTVSCHTGSVLGQNNEKKNVINQNLSMGERTVKGVE
jgi:hypothetical protein